MLRKRALVIVFAVVFAIMFAACGNGGGSTGGSTGGGSTGGGSTGGGGGAPAGNAPASIKIGIPNPFTGPLQAFGLGTPWAEQLVETAVNDGGGIYIEDYDTNIPIECVFVDTESDATKAGEVTQQLITNDGVSVLIARHTPGTALPVSAMAENMHVPFVSLECPINPWLAGGPYEWGYHSFWTVEEMCALYMDMWEELGYGEGTIVGGIFPNDPDGLAWKPVFEKMLPERGFVLHAELTEMMQGSWTNVINRFKQEKVQILTGVPINPDLASFLAESVATGFDFEFCTIGRAILFPSDCEAMPKELIPRLSNEIWWSPWHQWTSSIDGMTCAELAAAYEAEFNIPWSAPMGYKYAGMEIAVDALRRAASLDPVKIRDAIGATDLDTFIGHIKYDPETHVAHTKFVGGQWRVAGERPDGSPIAEIDCVFNKTDPTVPLNGKLHLPD